MNLSAPNQERWKTLCEEASQEKDSDRLMQLVKEINTILGGEPPRDGVAKVPSSKSKDAA